MTIVKMEAEGHCAEIVREPFAFRVTCSCGATWTHGTETVESVRLKIFEAHVVYARRPATPAL